MDLLVGIPHGTLMDIETTGLDENRHEIITLGFISGNQLSVIQRKVRQKTPFYREIRDVLGRLRRPFYAYNSDFEEKFIKTQLGLRVKLLDLMKPWREMANHRKIKWPKLDELVSEPEMYFDITRISASDIPSLWDAYLSSGNEKLLQMPLRHNRADLLKELYLLVQYPHLYELERETK
jgi:uncharacterized protein YprB with RNaseH-like and TPR domain